ncbi:MAG: site-2 protease family protein [Candidatus Geothermarchaeales archaeon]
MPFNPDIFNWEDVERITSIANEYFTLIDRYLDSGMLTFKIDEGGHEPKNPFQEFAGKMRQMGYLPVLRKEEGELLLRITFRPRTQRESYLKFLALLIATLSTVFLDGYLKSSSPLLKEVWFPYFSPISQAAIFTVAMFGIIAFHELGHKITLSINKIESSPPYFIPGIPGAIPTLGAVIMQREIPTNRDRLFDLGISGPVLGLIATIIVSIYAALNSPIISRQALNELFKQGKPQFINVPALFDLIQKSVRPLGPDQVIILDPITWAAIVGMLLTFLNVLPAWQLDGGHMSRAILGPRLHQLATLGSIMFMALIGFVPMALFILFLWTFSRGRDPGPLDDYSPVSKGRKVLFVVMLIIAILCVPLPFL